MVVSFLPAYFSRGYTGVLDGSPTTVMWGGYDYVMYELTVCLSIPNQPAQESLV